MMYDQAIVVALLADTQLHSHPVAFAFLPDGRQASSCRPSSLFNQKTNSLALNQWHLGRQTRRQPAKAWPLSVAQISTRQEVLQAPPTQAPPSDHTAPANNKEVRIDHHEGKQAVKLTYSSSQERRKATDAVKYRGPPLRLLLLGKPASGKGTLAPMLSRALRCVHISPGDLLRAEIKAQTSLGRIAKEQMGKGELLPTELILALLKKRLKERDCEQNGWILDGFPRNKEQAEAMEKNNICPDCAVILERPDEVVREFVMGRCMDSATGVIYHPQFNPPPSEVEHRLTWRLDDNEEVLERRLQQYHESIEDIKSCFKGLDMVTIDSATSDLQTFRDCRGYLERIARKLASKRPDQDTQEEGLPYPDVNVITPREEFTRQRTLVAAVRRCNRYDMRNYIPVYVEDRTVGYVTEDFASELVPYKNAARLVADPEGQNPKGAVVLAPDAHTAQERTQVVQGLVQELVASGAVSKRSLRGERQDVRCMLDMRLQSAPLLTMDRGAMILFGVPAFGVHCNAFVRHPNDADKLYMWIAKRSRSKATYAGLLDNFVAGGQPAEMNRPSFTDNMRRTLEKEASCGADELQNLRPVGQLSYRYATPKGLSTKILNNYDLEVSWDFVPYNGDGEVEEFLFLSVEEALDSIVTDLALWKPNSALVVIDFAIRHGYVSADDPDYLELNHLLRSGFSTSALLSQPPQGRKRDRAVADDHEAHNDDASWLERLKEWAFPPLVSQ